MDECVQDTGNGLTLAQCFGESAATPNMLDFSRHGGRRVFLDSAPGAACSTGGDGHGGGGDLFGVGFAP